jgi:hypothetical protein
MQLGSAYYVECVCGHAVELAATEGQCGPCGQLIEWHWGGAIKGRRSHNCETAARTRTAPPGDSSFEADQRRPGAPARPSSEVADETAPARTGCVRGGVAPAF